MRANNRPSAIILPVFLALAATLAACAGPVGVDDPEGVDGPTGIGGPADVDGAAARERLETVSLNLSNVGGEAVAIAQLSALPGGVFVEVEFTALPAGVHGFHIHETGICEPPFESAGGHFDPTNRRHGLNDEGGGHVGDLPNIFVPDSRLLTVAIVAAGAALDSGDMISLADQDGAALIVHAEPDDYESDPSGNAGVRIACGVIFPPATR